ncbi:EcoAI/FtnUII family type I restriction enzme subunit R [Palaeococcus ferrophilus]|uniref:EcoAI/FtnUII family type I restriction enzme subunit R n=1 Tax=Palaeococcus ferrophilus TaxID=83868 RepID=UPI00064EBD0E|nr:DEAD/DEAH box helicase family protein [Palaeococcus ferrophilus]
MYTRYSEEDTRAKLIDPKLHESGWDEDKIMREFTISVGRILNSDGGRTSPQRADYVLFYPNAQGHIIAVVEAKKAREDAYHGLEQAKRYAKALDAPFAYATNGLKIIEYDFFTKEAREIEAFPGPEELWERYTRRKGLDEAVKRSGANPLEVPYYIRDKKPRYYQEVAVRRAIEEILLGKKRLLLTMATGSGKTFVAFQIAWKLYKSGLVKKILFVVDRVYLRNQAYNAFEAFKTAREELKGDNLNFAKDVYFATYQTLYSEKDGKKVYQEFDPDYFDLVIIDECHRSGWNRWHDILKYFNRAIHLGLTATPQRADNVDVYDYFGKPVYEYKLAQGIEDGYLAPPEEIIRVYTNVDKNGMITFKELRTAGVKLEIPEGAEVKEYYTANEFEKNIILPDRTRAIVGWIARFLEETGPLEKTVIFCPTQRHAREVAALLNNHFNSRFGVDNYAYPIVSDDPESHTILRNSFASSQEPFPVVATTVDMLSTGIDVPTIKNIIFLKHVGSKVEFHQIIGRAARIYTRGDVIKKKYTFRIVDFTGATRLLDRWDFPPYKPKKERPTDWYLNMAIVDDETLEPVKGADVVIHVKPGKPLHVVAGDDGRVFQSNVPREAVLIDIRASGYRPKKTYVTTFPRPDSTTTVTLRKLNPENKAPITVHGLNVFIEEENKIRIEVRGNKVLEAEYVKYTREQVKRRVASLNDLKKVWLNRNMRLQFKKDLKKSGIDLKLLSLIEKVPEADEFDLLAHLLFDAPIVTRDERAELFREVKKEFIKKFGQKGRDVILTLLDHYRLYGLSEIEDPKVFELPTFREYGNLKGVLRILGGGEGLKKLLEELEKGLYADLMEG